MLLIPQIYLKNGKVAFREGTRSALFHESPLETARAMKAAGAEMMHISDLNVQTVGASPNFPHIKSIHDEAGLAIYVNGGFKTTQSVDACIAAGAEFVALGPLAYQQPAFLDELCKEFPGKIGTHIDVRGGRVTIPGYAVVTNKTAFDYAERFLDSGVRYILYSDVKADGTTGEENFKNLLEFCKKITARIICTSEVGNLADIEKIVKLSAPRLEGLILSKALDEDRIDLRSAIVMVNDLVIASGNESTIAEF
ncbi:MAG: HisA/HisF-related TIM barrel protein [bacterium]